MAGADTGGSVVPATPSGSRAEPGYLLDVFHRQLGDHVAVYAIGRLSGGDTFGVVDHRVQPRFYIRHTDAARARRAVARLPLTDCDSTTMDGEAVLRVTSGRLSAVQELAAALSRAGIRTYEADINIDLQWRLQHGSRGAVLLAGDWRPGHQVDRVYTEPRLEPAAWVPQLAVACLDIETNVDSGAVLAVSLVGTGPLARHGTDEIHLVLPAAGAPPAGAHGYADEAALLRGVVAAVQRLDPDVISGWNVVDFDLRVLQERCRVHGVSPNFGRTTDAAWYREGQRWGASRMVVHGRQVLDALQLVRVALGRFDDLRLDTVARQLLGRGKTLEAADDETMPDAILRAYTQDLEAFCAYCREDARLVLQLLQQEALLELTLQRSLVTGLPLERAWGSIVAFDLLYTGELHRRRVVAPTIGVDRRLAGGSPGGLVLPPLAGLRRHILVFDFRSLYPSLIRTFNLDPLAHVAGMRAPAQALRAPNGALFARTPGILPGLLATLFERRAQARAQGDPVAANAYKILMNSFYGVLATDACRYAADALAGAITGFGQLVLRWTRDRFAAAGHRVVYGDTDSLFVAADVDAAPDPGAVWERGEALCAWMNAELAAYVQAEFGVESRLELEFQKHYARFLLPPLRGSDRGRAKGYAGLRVGPDGTEGLEIVGMEAVRRDWTRLAHRLQSELLDLVFHDAAPDRVVACVRDCIAALRAGARDRDLVYRKGLRKPLASYTKSSPPHVQAARLLERPRPVIEYVVTRAGPQPVSAQTAPIDYQHYVDKQIAPLVRTLAQVTPLDADAALTGATDLFGAARR